MNFVEQVAPRIREAILNCLSSRAAPVMAALELALSDHAILGLTVCSLADGQDAVEVGAAMQLIHVGMQRLHVDIDQAERSSPHLGTAANVLAGDYLSSGAFKLLANCRSLEALRLIGRAMATTCELETAHVASRRTIRNEFVLSAPLGEAAGAIGSLLGGGLRAHMFTASSFGRSLSCANAYRRHAQLQQGREATILLAKARQACFSAMQDAQTILSINGNPRPFALAEMLATRLEMSFSPAATHRQG